MKPALLITLLFGFLQASAQLSGTLTGVLTDSTTNKPLPFAAIQLRSGSQTTGTLADADGRYTLKPIKPGIYTVTFSVLNYTAKAVEQVRIEGEKILFLNAQLLPRELSTVDIVFERYTEELLGAGTPAILTRISAEKLLETATDRGVENAIVALVPRVVQSDPGNPLHFSGSRSDASTYFIDGMKIIGEAHIPQMGIGEITVISAGVPAQYGDTTSGVVLIQTKSFW